MMLWKKILIVFSILMGIVIVGFIILIVTIISSFGGFDKDYSVTELKENFEKYKKEIYELKYYFNEIVPDNRFVEIEFENENTLFRFGIKSLDSTTGNQNGPMFFDWDLNIYTQSMDSIIRPMGWTRKTLKDLKDKLEKADCIQIESGEPTRIGFKRSGMGMYCFNVFDQPIPDSLREYYNDSCTYILANDKLVLEYIGGAVGPQRFYNLK